MAVAAIATAGLAATEPRVRAIVTPPSNDNGWNNTDVFVDFECATPIVCPHGIVVAAEGKGQRIRRTVVDENGREDEANVTINVDRTPPYVAIISRPPLSTRTANVEVTASVVDAEAGVATAACNGQAARLDGGLVHCTIGLADGINDIIVSATDLAGNSASAALAVTRTGAAQSLALLPSVATIAIGQGQPLQLVDNFGRTVADAEWATDDPSVARIVTTPTPSVAGVGPGVATVIAKSGALSARIQVTVMEEKLPLGTRRWAVDPPRPGLKAVFTPRLQEVPDGPDMLTVNAGVTGGAPFVITAMTETPRQLWIEQPAIARSERVMQWMGDRGGGALLLLARESAGPVSIVRVGRPASGTLWRYESAGRLALDWAMDWAGTLYVNETRPGGRPEIVAIDSDTGLAKFHIPLRPRRPQFTECESIVLGPPTIPDGIAAAYQLLVTFDARTCPAAVEKTWSKSEVYLLRVRADGSSEETLLTDFESAYPQVPPAVTLFRVIPDAEGGILAMMHAEVPGLSPMNRVFRQTERGIDSYSLPVLGETVTGHRWGFTTDEHTLIAFDPKTGRVGWSRRVTMGEIHIRFAEQKGGVVVETAAGQEVLSADDGSTISIVPVFGDFLPGKR